MATQRLYGTLDWSLDFKMFSPKGQISLAINGLDFKVAVAQPVNVSKKPKLQVVKLVLGNIQVGCTNLKLRVSSLSQRLMFRALGGDRLDRLEPDPSTISSSSPSTF